MNRIYVASKINDTRAQVLRGQLEHLELAGKVKDVSRATCYTIDKTFSKKQLERIATLVSNPVSDNFSVDTFSGPSSFDYVVNITFLPGVTDNVGNTVKEIVQDNLETKFDDEEG